MHDYSYMFSAVHHIYKQTLVANGSYFNQANFSI